METLQLLKDYASTNDNAWLTNKLHILEQEIQIAILEAEIKEIKKMRDNTKNIFN
jgi:hypothetical protein